MSQLAGRRLPQAGAANQNFNFVAVSNIDGQNNGGLATIAYGPNNTSYIDDTDAAALKIWYYLDKAPDASPAGAVWRVCRATVVSPGVSKYEWGCTVDPATGALVKCGGYDHLLADIRKTVAIAPALYPLIAYN